MRLCHFQKCVQFNVSNHTPSNLGEQSGGGPKYLYQRLSSAIATRLVKDLMALCHASDEICSLDVRVRDLLP